MKNQIQNFDLQRNNENLHSSKLLQKVYQIKFI